MPPILTTATCVFLTLTLDHDLRVAYYFEYTGPSTKPNKGLNFTPMQRLKLISNVENRFVGKLVILMPQKHAVQQGQLEF